MVEDPEFVVGTGPEEIAKETGSFGSVHSTTLVLQDVVDAVCCILFYFYFQGRICFLKKVQVCQN